ncbi:MAG: spermidine/putrescine ABC transporter permease PotC, partial [Lachnospiraceae bacterium]
MKRAQRQKTLTVLGRIYVALMYVFLFLPISVIVVNSMNATTSKPYLSWKGFTLSWYAKLWDNTALLSS